MAKQGFDSVEALEIFGDLLPKIGRKVLRMREERKLDPTAKKTAMKELVTAADLVSEALLMECVRRHWPHHGIRGEEGAEVRTSPGYKWLFDPVDGTNRFSLGMDMFAISAGLTLDGAPIFGVLYFPANGIFLNASRGRGAFLNRERLLVPPGGRLKDEIFVGFSVRNPEAEEKIGSLGCHIMEIHSFAGSTLLTIQGMLGAYAHGGATPFDLGAAALIAEEAGCRVSSPIDFSQEKIPVIIARNNKIFNEMRQICGW